MKSLKSLLPKKNIFINSKIVNFQSLKMSTISKISFMTKTNNLQINKINKKGFTQCSLNSKPEGPVKHTEPLVCTANKIDLSKISKNCYIEQISTSCISHYGYYIESDNKAFIIDPIRDIDFYLEQLKRRNSTLKFIGETHFHADFVSGHYDLAQKTGAPIIYGPGAKAEFKIVSAADESIFDLSDTIKIQVIHTPGHTLESSCFLILEKDGDSFKKLALFTGDTIFLGDVGRPDLAVKSDLSKNDLAALMYQSVQRVKSFPDDLLIFPGHGAGSACGKNIQSGTASTVGEQKKTNYAFSDQLKKDEFIEILTSNLPTPPQYFFFDAVMNHKAVQSVDELLKSVKIPLSASDFLQLVNNESVKVIDTRNPSEVYQTGIIPGAYCINLNMPYAIWAATLFKPTDKIAIISDEGKEEEAITRLARVGFDNILGYLDGGFEAWNKSANRITQIEKTEIEEAKSISENTNTYILDVRNEHEFECPGTIPHASRIPLPVFEESISKIDFTQKEVYVLCRTGIRALLAASIIRKYNTDIKVKVLNGGIASIIKLGYKPTNLSSLK